MTNCKNFDCQKENQIYDSLKQQIEEMPHGADKAELERKALALRIKIDECCGESVD